MPEIAASCPPPRGEFTEAAAAGAVEPAGAVVPEAPAGPAPARRAAGGTGAGPAPAGAEPAARSRRVAREWTAFEAARRLGSCLLEPEPEPSRPCPWQSRPGRDGRGGSPAGRAAGWSFLLRRRVSLQPCEPASRVPRRGGGRGGGAGAARRGRSPPRRGGRTPPAPAPA